MRNLSQQYYFAAYNLLNEYEIKMTDAGAQTIDSVTFCLKTLAN